MNWLRTHRFMINIVLLFVGVGVIIFYSVCGDTCSYLKGSIVGVDLEYLGMAYVAGLIFFNVLKKDNVILMLLSAGIGVEFFLVGYQVVNNTYCLYCLIFAAIIMVQFLLNIDVSKKLLIAICMISGFLAFLILFEGSAFPVYSHKFNHILSIDSVMGATQSA